MDSPPSPPSERAAPAHASRHPMSSRAAQAHAEIGRTEVLPRVAWLLVALFLAAIFAVPLLEVVRGLDGRAGANPPSDALLAPPAAGNPAADVAAPGLPRRILLGNRFLLRALDEIETRLEDTSLVAGAVRPWAQYLLTSWFGAGNEEVYPGRDGWLFHRPAVDYVTGPGFLDSAQLARRATSGDEWNPPPAPDPVAAILDFHRQLAGRGVALVVLPAPVKPIVHPDRFSSRYGRHDSPVQNASFERFRDELEAAGVRVFDPAPLLVEERLRTGRPQFLATDTHWRPEAVERVAQGLGAFLAGGELLPERPPHGYVAQSLELASRGDLARMLDLPATQRRFAPETLPLRPVTERDGTPWRPAPDADVLLLGDSFTNMYSLEELGWGTGAGLAEHLSLALDRPVDRITRNDAGAYATREMLARDLARGRDRLAGKRLVVYQFAARELAVGDWKRIDLPAERVAVTAPGRFWVPEPGAEQIAEGRVVAVATVPRPGTVPYKDHITAVHLAGVRGALPGVEEAEAVLYTWSMRDDVWTEAARWRPGQRVRLRVRPWAEVASRLEALNRSELPDADLELVEPWWVEEVLP
jgi:hypothetical protein